MTAPLASAWITVENRWRWTLLRGKGTADVSDDALTLRCADRSRIIPLRDLTEGAVLPEEGRARLRLKLADRGEVMIEARDVDEATELLSRLRLDAAHHTVAFHRVNPIARAYLMVVGTIFGMFPAIVLANVVTPFTGRVLPVQLLIMAVAMAGMWLAARFLRRAMSDVVVGADGIQLGKRFIAHADVTEVAKTTIAAQRGNMPSTRVAVSLRSGEQVTIATFLHQASVPSTQAEALALRIEQARRASAATPAALAELLEPPGEDVAALRTFVAELAEKIGNYRDATLSRAEILGVATDAATPPKRRIAAAMVYSHLYGAEGAAQIRVASENVVNEPMRIALEQVADGTLEDEAIERVLKA